MTVSRIGGDGPSANTNVTAGGGIYSTMSGALWLDHHLNETDRAV
jgi:hypothetical protein